MTIRILTGLFYSFLTVMLFWFLGYTDNRHLFLSSNPTSNDQGQHGFSQLREHIEQEGVNTKDIDSSYSLTLGEQSAVNNHNNLLFLSLPTTVPASQQELRKLADWVAKGNHLVAMLALDDQPHWLNKQNKFTIDSFLTTFELQLTRLDTGTPGEEDPATPSTLFSQLSHPVTYKVRQVQSGVVTQNHVWQLRGDSTPKSALILLREKQTLSPVAWLSLFGKGKIYVMTHSDLFSNANIGQTDNLQLAKNIINFSLGGSQANPSTVYFDDIHHATNMMPPLSNPIVHPFLILIIGMLSYGLLVFIVQNFPEKRKEKRIALTQWISNDGIQLGKMNSDNEIALGYAGHIFNHVRAKLNLPENFQPVWDNIRKQNVNTRVLQRVEKYYQRALQSKKINLDRFVLQLEKLRNQLK